MMPRCESYSYYNNECQLLNDVCVLHLHHACAIPTYLHVHVIVCSGGGILQKVGEGLKFTATNNDIPYILPLANWFLGLFSIETGF